MNITITARKDRLHTLTTNNLIEQYELAISSNNARFSNTAPRQKRINFIVDMLMERAENGDPTAELWLKAS